MMTQKTLSGETLDKILSKKAFPQGVKTLQSFRMYAPSKDDDYWTYKVVDGPEDMDMDFLTTALSPKKMIFPQRDVFLEFKTPEGELPEIKEVLPEDKPSIILGVRPCDAKALTLCDKVFDDGFKDEYYWKRRENTVLIGLACVIPPSPNCFCTSVEGSPHAKDGLDILMTDMGDRYHLESQTKTGDQLINAGGKGTITIRSM